MVRATWQWATKTNIETKLTEHILCYSLLQFATCTASIQSTLSLLHLTPHTYITHHTSLRSVKKSSLRGLRVLFCFEKPSFCYCSTFLSVSSTEITIACHLTTQLSHFQYSGLSKLTGHTRRIICDKHLLRDWTRSLGELRMDCYCG